MSHPDKRHSIIVAAAVLSVTGLAIPGASHAMSQEEYMNALKIAEQKVLREREAHSNAGALSSTLLAKLFGRYYQVGDTWDVAAWVMDQPQMRKTEETDALKQRTRKGGIFRYVVKEVKTGTSPQVKIEVTQLSQYGFAPVDSKVEKLLLTMNDKLMQSEKNYFLVGGSGPMRVSPDGIRSARTELELFPLDVPEVLTADQQKLNAMPELPAGAKELARQIGFKPDLGKSLWFEQDDFFGRPVQILWQHADPWPSYFRTPNGVAILIRKGTS
jgi:hypothetical protein